MSVRLNAGTVVSIGAGTNPVPAPGADTFTALARVTGGSMISISKPTVDSTDLDSTATESISGLASAGEGSLEINFDPELTPHQGLFADALAASVNAKRNFRFVSLDGMQVDIVGEITSFEMPLGPPGSIRTASCKITYSGAPTVTYA